MGYQPTWQRTACLLATALCVSLSGCFLQTISGATFAVDGSLITSVRTDSILTTCVQGGLSGGNVDCSYIFLNENGVPVESTSSAVLISEFGILGVVIDPLVMQVPGDAVVTGGTYDDGQGTSGDLVVQSGFKSIPVDTFRFMLAEPGQQFVIAELPDGVPFEGVEFSFELTFEQPGGAGPVEVKPLLALKFEVGASQIYYTPFMPCENDFANVAAIPIPMAQTPQPITLPGTPTGCSGEQYLLAGFGVFPCDFDGDDDVDRDDIAIQASVRNAPALLGDRLDNDGDGTITANDARRCALQCTRPSCATQVPLAQPRPAAAKGVTR